MSKKCACKGDFLDKFIQPAILSLLCEGPGHGLYLLTELETRGLVSDVDATGFYRTLHKLEEDGKLQAEWITESGGKAKKQYAITETGLRCLQNWQITLNNYIRLLQKIQIAVDTALLNRTEDT